MLDRPTAFQHQIEKSSLQMIGGPVVDHGSHIGHRLGMRFPDDQPLRKPHDLAEQFLVRPILNDQAPRRCAALPTAKKGRLYNHDGGSVGVRSIPHHDRIVAAHFQRQDLVRRLGKEPVQLHAGAR